MAAAVVAASLAPIASTASCSSDVLLGGSTDDASAPDDAATPSLPVDICEPCTTHADCPATARCVQIAGSLTFCATTCPTGTECASDETCKVASRGASEEAAHACVPSSGECSPAKAPVSESAPVEHCGPLDGPTIGAECRSCDADDRGCQRNGCYGGWWCNTTTRRCERPPATCP